MIKKHSIYRSKSLTLFLSKVVSGKAYAHYWLETGRYFIPSTQYSIIKIECPINVLCQVINALALSKKPEWQSISNSKNFQFE